MPLLDAQSTALLIIDVQHGTCHPRGQLYSKSSSSIIEPLAKLIRRARKAAIPIFYTKDPIQNAPRRDNEILTDISPGPEDSILEKRAYSAFSGTNLSTFLKKQGIKKIICAGLLTDVCVYHTATDAVRHQFDVVVLADCTQARNTQAKYQALKKLDNGKSSVLTSSTISFTP